MFVSDSEEDIANSVSLGISSAETARSSSAFNEAPVKLSSSLGWQRVVHVLIAAGLEEDRLLVTVASIVVIREGSER